MEVRAVAKYVRVQPRKVRIVADKVRGQSAQQSADVLRFHPSKGAFYLRKVLISAIANAQENHGLSPEQLRVATVMVDEGPHMKRIMARAMGRANRILKKTSHITVVVEEMEPEARVKPHGTKAKPRPKFDAPKGKKPKKAEEAAPAEEPVAEAEAEEAQAEEAPVEAVEAQATEAVAEEPPGQEATAEEPTTDEPKAEEESK
jgi:large subunit ribosomal protein L22